MKKFVFILFASFLCSINCFSQIKGISKYSIIHSEKEAVSNSHNYEKWLLVGNDTYIKLFEQTPVGYMHEVKEVKKLCNLYGKDIESPDEDNSLIPDYAKNIFDYSNMDLGLSTGSAEISKYWFVVNSEKRYFINFTANKKCYCIAIHMK
ncbi:MAG: hypothetical protein WCS51_04625 [Bacilli bacterium]